MVGIVDDPEGTLKRPGQSSPMLATVSPFPASSHLHLHTPDGDLGRLALWAR